jgi:hypothetical protein
VGALMRSRTVSISLAVLILLAYAVVLLRGEIVPLIGQLAPLA